jgi:hypothetical protein
MLGAMSDKSRALQAKSDDADALHIRLPSELFIGQPQVTTDAPSR